MIGTSHWNDAKIYNRWVELLDSQHVLKLEDPTKICETLALTIGMNENKCSPDGKLLDLVSDGVAEKLRLLNEMNKAAAKEE